MFKLGYCGSANLQEYRHPGAYNLEQAGTGERMVIGLGTDHINTVLDLISVLKSPFYMLYVLHTPRTGHAPGRYQSGSLTHDEIGVLLNQFRGFFENDSRHDMWIYSPATETTIVYDRHNLIYLYGFKEEHVRIIEKKGLKKEPVKVPVPHVHKYNAEYDHAETELVNQHQWRRSPLQDEDRQ